MCNLCCTSGVAYKDASGRVLPRGAMPSLLEDLEKVQVVYESTFLRACRATCVSFGGYVLMSL